MKLCVYINCFSPKIIIKKDQESSNWNNTYWHSCWSWKQTYYYGWLIINMTYVWINGFQWGINLKMNLTTCTPIKKRDYITDNTNTHMYKFWPSVKNQSDSKLKLSFIPSLKLCEIPKFVFGFDVVYNYKNTYEC